MSLLFTNIDQQIIDLIKTERVGTAVQPAWHCQCHWVPWLEAPSGGQFAKHRLRDNPVHQAGPIAGADDAAHQAPPALSAASDLLLGAASFPPLLGKWQALSRQKDR